MIRVPPGPEDARWALALSSARRVATACSDYARVPESVCRAMASAFLDDLGAAGYLAPLDTSTVEIVHEGETFR